MDATQQWAIVVASLLAALLGLGLFVEVVRYTECHAVAEDAGYVPHYDPVTLKCRVSLF